MLWGGLSALPVAAVLASTLSFSGELLGMLVSAICPSAALTAGLWGYLRQVSFGPTFLLMLLQGWFWGSIVALLSGFGMIVALGIDGHSSLLWLAAGILGGGLSTGLIGLMLGWGSGVIPLLGPLWLWGLHWAAIRLGVR